MISFFLDHTFLTSNPMNQNLDILIIFNMLYEVNDSDHFNDGVYIYGTLANRCTLNVEYLIHFGVSANDSNGSLYFIVVYVCKGL